MALATTVTKGQPLCVRGDVAHNYKHKGGTKQKQQKGVTALLSNKPNKWLRHRITAAEPSTHQSQPLFQ